MIGPLPCRTLYLYSDWLTQHTLCSNSVDILYFWLDLQQAEKDQLKVRSQNVLTQFSAIFDQTFSEFVQLKASNNAFLRKTKI